MKITASQGQHDVIFHYSVNVKFLSRTFITHAGAASDISAKIYLFQ